MKKTIIMLILVLGTFSAAFAQKSVMNASDSTFFEILRSQGIKVSEVVKGEVKEKPEVSKELTYVTLGKGKVYSGWESDLKESYSALQELVEGDKVVLFLSRKNEILAFVIEEMEESSIQIDEMFR